MSEILVAIAKRNPFQIGQERQADTIALDLLARSGYDPRSLVMLMKKLQVSAPARGPGGFVTMHPGWPERVAEVEAQLEGPMALYEKYKAEHSGKPATTSARPQQPMRQPGKPQKPQRPPQKGASRSTPSQLGVPAAKPAPPAPAQPAATAEPQPATPAPATPPS